MSYTLDTSKPDDILLFASQSESGLYTATLQFVCPRCGERQHHSLHDINGLLDESGLEVTCANPQCGLPDERPGYHLTMYMSWAGRTLSLSDRPLHSPSDNQ